MSPLFKDAHEALTFAFNFSHQQYPRSPMFRAILQSRGGRGLGGLDGAAQAGMIKQEVSLLKPLERAYIVARYEPIVIRCHFGNNRHKEYILNKVWVDAMGELSIHIRNRVLLRCVTTTSMRMDYIMRFLPCCKHACINALAEKHNASEKTIRNHIKEVKKFFCGNVVNNTRRAGLEEKAMTAITDRLERSGIIGLE